MFTRKTKDRTNITVLLDRSGSMQSVYYETVEGFETFVAKQREIPGNCRLTLCQFDTVYVTVFRNRPLHRVGSLNLRPRGGTALYDAMGRCITDLAHRSHRNPPARQIVVIITDGLENSSRAFGGREVRQMVQHHTKHDDWQFVYLGANQDAIEEARRVGIDEQAAMTYVADHECVKHAWNATASAVARHRRSAGARVSGSYFTDEERRAAGGK